MSGSIWFLKSSLTWLIAETKLDVSDFSNRASEIPVISDNTFNSLSITKAHFDKPSRPIKRPSSNNTLSLGCITESPLYLTSSSVVPINNPKSNCKDALSKSFRKLLLILKTDVSQTLSFHMVTSKSLSSICFAAFASFNSSEDEPIKTLFFLIMNILILLFQNNLNRVPCERLQSIHPNQLLFFSSHQQYRLLMVFQFH